jgi:hypothetical protein
MKVKQLMSTQHDTPPPEGERRYEQSGLYPPGEKPFRVLALMGWLAGVIIFIAVSAIVLDRLLIAS